MILERKTKAPADEMVPVEKWDGECWKTFFEQFCVPSGEMHGISPWEYLANFIKKVYGGRP